MRINESMTLVRYPDWTFIEPNSGWAKAISL